MFGSNVHAESCGMSTHFRPQRARSMSLLALLWLQGLALRVDLALKHFPGQPSTWEVALEKAQVGFEAFPELADPILELNEHTSMVVVMRNELCNLPYHKATLDQVLAPKSEGGLSTDKSVGYWMRFEARMRVSANAMSDSFLIEIHSDRGTGYHAPKCGRAGTPSPSFSYNVLTPSHFGRNVVALPWGYVFLRCMVGMLCCVLKL